MSGKDGVDLFVAYHLSVHCLSMDLFLVFQVKNGTSSVKENMLCLLI